MYTKQLEIVRGDAQPRLMPERTYFMICFYVDA